MLTLTKSLRFLVGGLLVLMLGGLAGWYFYLHSKESSSSALDTARGLDAPTPSFTGEAGSTQNNQSAVTFGSSGSVSTSSSSPLWKVDRAPVAGMGFVQSGTTTVLYYTEHANGYLFTADPSTRSTMRLTDTLMPKIYEAFFAQDGSVIERSIDANGLITTFLGHASTTPFSDSTSTSPDVLLGFYLTPNIQAISLNPTDRTLLYLLPDTSGTIDGITQNWDGSKKKTLFSSVVGSWEPYYLSDGRMMLLESPADNIPGFAYQLSASGSLTPLVRNIAGLTILPQPAGSALIYGSSSGGLLSLFAVATGTPAALALHTIAQKCVWLPGKSMVAYCAVPTTIPSNSFLDDWYKGSAHTSDAWWQVNVETGAVTSIYSPSASDNVSLDVENPIMDPSGTYIAFINATDQSLWILNVAQ